MSVQTQPFVTPEEYLERERRAEYKSEYYRGEIFPLGEPRGTDPADMAGAQRNHVLLVSKVVTALNNALQDRTCLVFPADMRVHVAAYGLYTYPDVAVVCGEEHYLDEQQDTLLNPVLLVEVLSRSTESYDRGTRFAFYRSIASLREYALVSQRQKMVEVFRKNEEGLWVLHEFDEARNDVALASVDCTLRLDDLYANVTLEEVSLR